MKNLDNLRQQINQIDEKIDDLLNHRFNISKSIALYKLAHDQNIYDQHREQQLLQHFDNNINLSFLPGHIYLKKQLMFASRQYQYQFIDITTDNNKAADMSFAGYTKEQTNYMAKLKVKNKQFHSYKKLINALITEEIDTAVTSFTFDNIANLKFLYKNNIYINKIDDTTFYLSKILSLKKHISSLGIVITLNNKQTISQILNLFDFYQITIQQLFLLSSTQLFICFNGDIHNQNIQRLLYILAHEYQKTTLQFIH